MNSEFKRNFLENDRCNPTGLTGYLRERSLKRLFLCVDATNAAFADVASPALIQAQISREKCHPDSPGIYVSS